MKAQPIAKRVTTTISILLSSFFFLPAAPVHAEALLLYRNTAQHSAKQETNTSSISQRLRMKLDEKGDLMVLCGCARLVVAYNAPTDQLKPGEQHFSSRREEVTALNGISFTASMSF